MVTLLGLPDSERLESPSDLALAPRPLGTHTGSARGRSMPGAATSIRIATRMPLSPLPGRSDHRLEVGACRSPAEDLRRSFRARHQQWRVTGPARSDRVRDRMPDDGLGSREHLADGEAAGVAEVERERLVRPRVVEGGRLEGEEVSVGEVGDVDVVADAGAVRRRIVIAEDSEGDRALGCGQD